MQLLDWLKANGSNPTALGAQWNVVKSAMSRIVRGDRMPTFVQVVKAYVHTGQMVTLDDWIELNRPALEEDGVIPKGWKPHGG